MLEQRLLDKKGIVVVDITEAHAIAEELAIDGCAGVRRKLPLYFNGEFRNEGIGEARSVSFHLTLRRGSTILDETNSARLKPVKAGQFLLKTSEAMLAKALGKTPSLIEPDIEAKALVSRAKEFQQIGNWKEALMLLDASLLLAPDQPDVLMDAAVFSGKLVTQGYDPYGDFANFSRKALKAVDDYRRMRFYLDRYARLIGKPGKNFLMIAGVGRFHNVDGVMDYILRYAFLQNGGGRNEGEEVRHQLKEFLREERDRVFEAIDNSVYTERSEEYSAFRQLDRLLHFSLPVLGEPIERQNDMKLRTLRYIAQIRGDWHDVYRTILVNVTDKERHGVVFEEFLSDAAKIKGACIEEGVRQVRNLISGREVGVGAKPTGKSATQNALPEKEPEIIFSEIPLSFEDELGKKLQTPERCWGWIPCGEMIDAAWGPKDLYLMKAKGKLKRIFISKDQHFNIIGASYDGKYLWAPVRKKIRKTGEAGPTPASLVLVVDPKTEQSWQFTAEDGLPDMISIASAPVAPGVLFISGATDRAWCAMLSLGENGAKKVEIFLEAKSQPDPAITQEVVSADPNISFIPMFAARLGGVGDQPLRILVGRKPVNGSNYPLLIDPKARNVSVVKENMHSHLIQSCVTEHEGSLYWAGTGVYRVALTALRPTIVSEQFLGACSSSKIFFDGKWTHVIEDNPGRWWMAASPSGLFNRLGGKVPKVSYLSRIYHSNFYGMILSEATGKFMFYAVEVLKTPSTKSEKESNQSAPSIELAPK